MSSFPCALLPRLEIGLPVGSDNHAAAEVEAGDNPLDVIRVELKTARCREGRF